MIQAFQCFMEELDSDFLGTVSLSSSFSTNSGTNTQRNSLAVEADLHNQSDRSPGWRSGDVWISRAFFGGVTFHVGSPVASRFNVLSPVGFWSQPPLCSYFSFCGIGGVELTCSFRGKVNWVLSFSYGLLNRLQLLLCYQPGVDLHVGICVYFTKQT